MDARSCPSTIRFARRLRVRIPRALLVAALGPTLPHMYTTSPMEVVVP